MNIIVSWMNSALWFLMPLAVTSLVGFGCYRWVHWLDIKSPELLSWMEAGAVSLAVCSTFTFLFISSQVVVRLLILFLICPWGTYAERAINFKVRGWGAEFVRTMFTMVCCVLVSHVLLMVLVVALMSSFHSVGPGDWFSYGAEVGALCSVPVVSIFIWMWRSSQTRPGIETHIDGADEEA